MSEFIENNGYEILTPTGFQKFTGIRKLSKPIHWIFHFESGKEIKCSFRHPFIKNGKTVRANDLTNGEFIDCGNGINDIIVDKQIVESPIELYDIIGVDNGNLFIVDGIISHNCDFITSGHTVIPGDILQWYKETHITEPQEKRGINRSYWIWNYPDYRKEYIVTVDVSRGDASDYSTVQVFDIETVEQCAEFKDKVTPSELGHLAISIATEYNHALLAIENTGIGYAAVQVPMDEGYKNLYYSLKEERYVDDNLHIAKAYDIQDKSALAPGFSTNTRTRPLMISRMEMYMLQRTPIIRSARLIEELFVFVWDNHKAQARQGYHDDLVIPFAMSLWIRDTALRLRQRGIELTKQKLAHFHRGLYTSTDTANPEKWNRHIGSPGEDLRWLL